MIRPLEKSIWSCELFGGPDLETDFNEALIALGAKVLRADGAPIKGVLLLRNMDNRLVASASSAVDEGKTYIDGVYAIASNFIHSDIFRPPPAAFQLRATHSRLFLERGSSLSVIGVTENPPHETQLEWAAYQTDMLIDRKRYKSVFEARLGDIPPTEELEEELVRRFATEVEIAKSYAPALRVLLSKIEARFASILTRPSNDHGKLAGIGDLIAEFLGNGWKTHLE